MGTKITKVTSEGVSAETAGAITLFITDHFGIPVSTKHNYRFYQWGWFTKRVSAKMESQEASLGWVLTIPISAIVAGITYLQ
jgi:PiT family inorganic phosphate transporter